MTLLRIEPDLVWLLDARNDIQRDMLDIFTLVREHREAVLRPTGEDGEVTRSVCALQIGASFSLWRAVFLSDIARHWPEVIDGATFLLEELLITNTLHFSTERESRNWMFGYYVKNAMYRVAESRERLGAPITPTLANFEQARSGGLVGKAFDSTHAWSATQSALRALTSVLRGRVVGTDAGLMAL